jgi:phosphoglycerate kinase
MINHEEQDCHIWNGPAGMFEFKNFSKGTESLLDNVIAMTNTG